MTILSVTTKELKAIMGALSVAAAEFYAGDLEVDPTASNEDTPTLATVIGLIRRIAKENPDLGVTDEMIAELDGGEVV